MKASTLVFLRRKIGTWSTHSHPELDDREGAERLMQLARLLEDQRREELQFVKEWRRELVACLVEKENPPRKVTSEAGECAAPKTPARDATKARLP